MASAPIGPESRSVIARSRAAQPRLDALALALSNREVIEQFVLAAIDMLDLLDGNPDEEPCGDEQDGSLGEDDFRDHHNCPGHLIGPGCPVSDPDMGIEDEGHDDENDDREDDEITVPAYGIDQTKGTGLVDRTADYAVMKPHRDRLRATRCDIKRVRVWGRPDVVEYRLRDTGDRPRADA